MVAAHITHRILGHHVWVVDHAHQVDDGDCRVEHVGAEEVLVQGDPLAAQAPVHTITITHNIRTQHKT